MTPVEQITSLYIGYFGRAPEPAGLNYWVGRLNDGFSLAEIAESFSVQPEATTKYPYLANPNIASPQAFIMQIYMNLFNRAPDAAGLAYWTEQLQNGADVGSFILDVTSGAQGDDLIIVENKIEVGVYAAEQAANTPNFVYDADAQAAAVAVIDGVDATDASVVAAKAEVDAFLDGDQIENTVVLTTAIDNAVGTVGNDQFNGVVAAAAEGPTFTTGDTISGGAGNDVLNLIVASAPAGAITPAGLTGVETIRVQALDFAEINLVNAVGVETLSSSGSSDDVSFVNVGNLVDVELVDIDSGNGIAIDFDADVIAGTDDTISVLVDSADTEIDVAGVENLDVTVEGALAGGASNVLDLDSSVVNMTISGSGDLEVEDLDLALVSVDASAATGDIVLDLSFTGDVAITGGAGDDIFEFGTTLTTADTVTGGAGFDSVIVDTSGTSDYSAAADAAAFNALSGVERAWFQGLNGVTLNGATFTNAGITNIEFQTLGDDFINNAGSARTYEFGSGNAGDATFNMNAASTALNLKFFAGSTVDVLDVNLNAQQPVAAVSTVNIESDGVGGAAIGSIDLKAGSTINVTGVADLNLGFLETKATINAAAFTGDLTVLGSDIDASLGANAGDVITLGSGQDTVLFDGNDSGILVNVGTVATPDLRLVVDIINNFTAGANGDVLDYTGPLAPASDADYTAISADAQADITALSGVNATLQAAADIASLGTADEWTAFTFQGQTYALYNADATADYTAGTDLLVQITGVTVANLTDANFA